MRSFSAGAVVIATLALHTEGSAVAKENSSDRGGVREVGRKRTQHKEPRMDGRRTGGHRQILNKGGYAYEYGYGYGYGYKDDDESGCDTLDCLMAEVDEDVTQINLSEEDRSVSHVEPWVRAHTCSRSSSPADKIRMCSMCCIIQPLLSVRHRLPRLAPHPEHQAPLSGTRYSPRVLHDPQQGTIPSEVGLLTEVTSLRLEYNNLDGSLPTELGSMVNMEYVGTHFMPTLTLTPTPVSTLTLTLTLTLTPTSTSTPAPILVSPLPNPTSYLPRYLDLGSNSFDTGTIPTELGMLTQLWDHFGLGLVRHRSCWCNSPTDLEPLGTTALVTPTLGSKRLTPPASSPVWTRPPPRHPA